MEYNEHGLKVDDLVIKGDFIGKIISMTPSGKFSVVEVAGEQERVLTSSLGPVPEKLAEQVVNIEIKRRRERELDENAKKQSPSRRRIVARFEPENWKGNPKINRNDPCPCGSGRKYKKCHLLREEAELTLWLKEHRYGKDLQKGN